MTDTISPEIQHRIAYGHLSRTTWRWSYEGAINRPEPTPINSLFYGDTHKGGVVGYAGNPQSSPAIIMHNRPPDQIEIRLRWLGAKVDIDDPSRAQQWLYAPDVADMMLDRNRVVAIYTAQELLAWLKEWASIQDWGQEPVAR